MIWPLLIWFILSISSATGNSNKKSGDSEGVTLFVHNKCPFAIWPALAPNGGFPVIGDGGFLLTSGRTHRVVAPWKWTGRLWGRTACNFSSSGRRACETGDCGGRLHCNALPGIPPVTLFQVSVRSEETKLDYYDVSAVDGYNLPISVSARGANANAGSCSVKGCVRDVNAVCPSELRVTSDSGSKVVACKSGCLAFNADAFCCRNEYGTADKCGPSVYSNIFKEACPSYYSYAFDSPSPLVSCAAKEYQITFCPSARTSAHLPSAFPMNVDI